MKKFLLAIFISLLTAVTASADFNYDLHVNGVFYIRDGYNNLMVVYEKDSQQPSYSGDVVIPDIVWFGGAKFPVTRVGNYALYRCKGVTSVTLPSTLKEIYRNAFSGCNIQEIVIPESLVLLDIGAFWDCKKLVSISLPQSEKLEIGYQVFLGTAYANNKTNWDNGALYIDNYLVQVDSSVPSKFTIKDGTITICERLFFEVNKITEVVIPESVKRIGTSAFYNCTKLKTVTVYANDPSSITTTTPFYGCDMANMTLYVPKGSKYNYENAEYWKEFGTIIEMDADYDFAETNEGTVIYYKINSDNSTVSVTFKEKGTYHSYSGDVVIPGTVTHNNKTYKVTGIGDWAFSCCTELTSVSIPSTVTSFGYQAFEQCDALTSVTIPESVKTIGTRAFVSCDGITSMDIPEGVTTIGERAFYYCTHLEGVSIPKSVTSIGNEAFNGCSRLATVKSNNAFPANITMGTDVFSRKGTLIIPKGSKSRYQAISAWSGFTMTEMAGVYAFSAQNAEGVEMYYNINADGKSVSVTYNDDTNYNSYSGTVVIPESVTYNGKTYAVTGIGDYAFRDCDQLDALSIPETVTYIGKDAFKYAMKLFTLTVNNDYPEDIALSHDGIGFTMPNNMAKLVVPKGSAWRYNKWPWTYISTREEMNAVYDFSVKDKYGNKLYFYYDTEDGTPVLDLMYKDYNYNSYSGDIVIPESAEYEGETYPVTGIMADAFKNCADLKSVSIPKTVTTIGASAFENCKALESPTLPEGLTTIGQKAFMYCENVTWMIMPNTVTYIGPSAFEYSGVYNLSISKSLTKIDKYVFYGCDGLTSVTIPNSVKTIGDYAFDNCANLTTVNIPGSVTTIGDGAFMYCEKLANVTLGGGITTIGPWAFDYCSSLASIAIPASVTTIGKEAFIGCTKLQRVTCHNSNPASITLGTKVFANTMASSGTLTVPSGSAASYKKLDQWKDFGSFSEYDQSYDFSAYNNNCPIYYKFNDDGKTVSVTYMNTSYNSYSGDVTVPANVTYNGKTYTVTTIGFRAFYGSVGLTSVTLPETVTKLDNLAFDGCYALTDVNLPNSLTLIGPMAFENCTSLKHITIPESVTEIGSWAFRYCTALTRIEIPESVTTLGMYAFSGCTSLKDVTLPASISHIGSEAFMNCKKLMCVTVKNPDPASIYLGDNIFSQTPKSTALLYVPKGSVSKYETAAQWKDFGARAEYIEWQTGDANSDGTVNVSDIAIIIDYMLERNPNNFDESAADVNGDGKINVIDISGIIQILLSK